MATRSRSWASTSWQQAEILEPQRGAIVLARIKKMINNDSNKSINSNDNKNNSNNNNNKKLRTQSIKLKTDKDLCFTFQFGLRLF